MSTTKTGQMYTLEIDTDIVMGSDVSYPVILTHKLSKNEKVVAESSAVVTKSETVTSLLTDLNVNEWSPESPELYSLETLIQLEDTFELLESQSRNVGFKTTEMLPDKGLLLNGEAYKLKGFCEHHDLGALGAAFNPNAMRHRMKLFKEMGVNAIRTSHNMPAKELMELADEVGFLIASESFDMWERSKTAYDYARFFKDWAYLDVKSWVKRDRNHVSLLLWTIGNEIYDTHADERGLTLTRQLTDWVTEFDPKENALVTLGSNYMPWENAQKCADLVKIVG
ncbi:MAG: glycoside hydrolase family 2, partial [Proteobacteria bacterium]|nr:glycoside hydrolase family 2 [Pseudomonadota bacterium]